MSDCQVFLIPGFFGFQSFGSYNYFNGISDIIIARLKEGHGINAEIINCRTKPTGSLTSRARSTVDEVLLSGGHKARSLHFVGHSTGGLDARLLLTPGVKLRQDDYEKEIVKRTRSLTTVSTPHYGTPIASFFTTFQGKHILNMLTALANNKRGRQGIFWAAQAAGLVAKADNYLGLKNTILDEFANNIIKKLTLEDDDPVWDYLKKVQQDQGALLQLTPEGMDLFNAAVIDAPEINYRSVISATNRPALTGLFSKYKTPSKAGSMALFLLLREICSRPHKAYPCPRPSNVELVKLEENLSFKVDERTNDGVSPCLSQIHGKLLTSTQADHLDIVGQFNREGLDQKYADWLVSNSHFNEDEFRRVWVKVADEIAASERE